METVSFITTVSGDDLIVSFAVQTLEDPMEIESLIILRTPKYEFVFEEDDRGAKVSFKRGEPDSIDDDEFLESVEYWENKGIVRLETASRRYQLDVRKVNKSELKEMRRVFARMNFDDRFRTFGL